MEDQVVAPEANVETQEANVDIQETKVAPENQETNEKPWERQAKREKPQSIPYERFSEVNSKYRESEKQLEAERQARAELESRLVERDKPKEIEDSGDAEYDSLVRLASSKGIQPPDPDDFYSLKDFSRAERKFQAALAELKAEQTYASLRHSESLSQELRRVNDDFMGRVEKATEIIPDLPQAIDYFRQYSEFVPPQLQRAIATHPNGPEILYQISSDPKLLAMFIEHPQNQWYDPIESQILIRSFGRGEQTTTQDKFEQPVVKTAPVVKKVTGGSSGKASPYTAGSMAEYRRARGM